MPNLVADSLPRLKRLLPRLKGHRLGVLGDLMLDRYLWGTASRLSPEAAAASAMTLKGSPSTARRRAAHAG